ncbi:MAG: hypothetical protein GY714_02695 [Desulfobacterales bacterium]|nr:hypothetical protein [Desulfobacterales bacterium]
MIVETFSHYQTITEKEFCCVPAVLQMIQGRRGLSYHTQDQIGYELGLIVPQGLEHLFDKVRTGNEPSAGYGTQTSREEFSIQKYFVRNNLPLRLTKLRPTSLHELSEQILTSLKEDADVIICYNSQILFGDGDIEHVSLIQQFDTLNRKILVVDPAIGVPKLRNAQLDRLLGAVTNDAVSDNSGLWIVSDEKK